MIDRSALSKLRRLMEARVKRDDDKKVAETSEKYYREIEDEVYHELEESGVVGTVKVDLGDPFGVVSFKTRETAYGRVIDDDAALEYFENRGMVDDVTAPKFKRKRVSEIVRELLEDGETEMPPGVDYYFNRGVTITRQKD